MSCTSPKKLVAIGPTDRRTHGITSGRVFGKKNVVYRPARPATPDDDAGTAASLRSSALRSFFVDLFSRPLWPGREGCIAFEQPSALLPRFSGPRDKCGKGEV